MLSQGRSSKFIRCLMVLIVCALLLPASNVFASDTPPPSDILATYQFLPDPDYTQADEKALLRVSSSQDYIPRLQFIWLDPQGEEVSCLAVRYAICKHYLFRHRGILYCRAGASLRDIHGACTLLLLNFAD